MTTDVNVGWRTDVSPNEAAVHNGNDVNFDIQHPVNSTLTTVTGNINASYPQIYFRIGLKSALPDYPAVPVRYGVVLITYKNNTMKHRIWIRQGEGADFVMTNSDPVNSEGLTTRTVTKRFSPYNLTATSLDTAVDLPGASGSNPGKFADYPSQAGALFQWAYDFSSGNFNRVRWAWNPYMSTIPTSPVTSSWVEYNTPSFWAPLEANQEICPSGYRRPNDGTTSASGTGSNQTSELRQSLYVHPRNGFNYASEMNNVVWGYYADGFFDRRLIASDGTVASNSRNIASTGTLFYNPNSGSTHYCASLFFCNSGFRHPALANEGGLQYKGVEGRYWTSTADHSTSGKYYGVELRLYSSPFKHAGPWRSDKAAGDMIRCVKE
jgi:hypothetical protein